MPFRDGFFPEQGDAIKSWFEELKRRTNPDLILTHRRNDAHQDHRQNGDIGRPNLYMPVSAGSLQRKIDLLISHFGSQRSKQWFDAETFLGLARLRGMECCASERYAEAFFAA
jgi:hypothetical protein